MPRETDINVRPLLSNRPFSTFNREERNCVAMLYHVLLLDGNLQRFVDQRGWVGQVDWHSWEMAVEWSYLRDEWNSITDQDRRRQIVEKGLGLPPGTGGDAATTTEEFNAFYGATPRPSKEFIQSPATWHLPRMAEHLGDSDGFLAACKLKWAFRVKPDLVITDGNRLLCIEAKWDSTESRYPTVGAERKVFAERELALVSQTTLQRFLLTDLLGFDGRFLFLARRPGADVQSDTITWKQAFEGLDLSSVPAFIKNWVRNLSIAP